MGNNERANVKTKMMFYGTLKWTVNFLIGLNSLMTTFLCRFHLNNLQCSSPVEASYQLCDEKLLLCIFNSLMML